MKIEKYMMEPAGTIQACEHHNGTGGLTKLELGALIIAGALKSNPNCDYDREELAHDSLSNAISVLKACHEVQDAPTTGGE